MPQFADQAPTLRRADATHGDYGGQNWLRGSGRLRVIDFSEARYNATAVDFARLYIGPWWERPDLSAAFFEGYGRPATDDELACVRLQLPTLAISLIAHGHRHGHLATERRGRHRLHQLVRGHDDTRRPRTAPRPHLASRGLVARLAPSLSRPRPRDAGRPAR